MTSLNACRKMTSQFSFKKAHVAQLEGSKRVIKRDALPKRIKYVGGVDVAYTEKLSISAAIVLDYDSLSIIESKTVHTKIRFPYIPTLLAFREIPPAISAIRRLRLQPDVFLVDGHGIMHPNRFGLASHLGVVLSIPTIGVAKNPLIGEIGRAKEEGLAPIVDNGEVVGVELVTRKGAKPVYVSIGHMTSLARTIEVVRHCSSRYRIPEPLRLAHIKALEEKSRILKS